MTAKNFIANFGKTVTLAYFVLNGKTCGVEADINGGVPSTVAWCGDKTVDVDDIDSFVNATPFYDGKTLADRWDTLSINVA